MKHSSKIIYATLFISLAIHIWLLLSANLFASKTVTETELKPVTVTLQQYTLEDPPPAPPVKEANPAKDTDNQPKPTTKKDTPEKTKPQSQGASKGITGLNVNPIKPKGPTKNTTAQTKTSQNEQTSDASEPESDDDKKSKNGSFQANNESNSSDSTEQNDPKSTKLTSKDIAENNGIIAPKDGQKPTFPRNAILRYEGPAGITGTMTFNRGDNKYSAKTQFNIPFYSAEFTSTGSIKNEQFVPDTFTDKRKGKVYSQAIFDYENQIVKYGKASGETKEEPMQGIPQDYLSLAWQMAANGGRLSQPTQITSGKTIYVRGNFTPEGAKELDTSEGKIKVQVFRINKGDDGIEFAFAEDFANIPAQITLYQDDGKKKHVLTLIGMTLDGKEYWKAVRKSGASKSK